MFRPNLTAEVSKVTGATLYGKKSYGAWTLVRVGIVKLDTVSDKTSVRTDSSGSRGHAQEITADARLLFPIDVIVRPGDRIRLQGVTLTVQTVWPRHAVTGRFDHWQVDCMVYDEGAA